jgi:hypothetical protein
MEPMKRRFNAPSLFRPVISASFDLLFSELRPPFHIETIFLVQVLSPKPSSLSSNRLLLSSSSLCSVSATCALPGALQQKCILKMPADVASE